MPSSLSKGPDHKHAAVPHGEVRGYTRLQRRLHWWVALLLVCQFLFQGPMREAMHSLEAGESPGFAQFLITTVHISVGLSIGCLAVWRLQLRRVHPVPVAGGALAPREAFLIGWHHRILYGALLLMVLTGVMHYFLEWPEAARWHELGKWVLVVLVAVHLAGVLRHELSGGQSVLFRMRGDSDRR